MNSAVSVNAMYCHACNILVPHMLTDFERQQIQTTIKPLSGPSDERIQWIMLLSLSHHLLPLYWVLLLILSCQWLPPYWITVQFTFLVRVLLP